MVLFCMGPEVAVAIFVVLAAPVVFIGTIIWLVYFWVTGRGERLACREER